MSKASRQIAEKAGRRGELWAAIYLRLLGHTILETRFKTKLGEIDLIARRGNTIIFVEVKHRRSIDAGLWSVTPHQTARIDAAAKLFMARLSQSDGFERRNDIIITGASWKPHHIKEAGR